MPSRLSVQLAKMAMKLAPRTPDANSPTLHERFNRREFTEGSTEDRSRMMVDAAQSRFDHECEFPLHIWFGFDRERMAALMTGKCILDLGCFVGGATASHAEMYGAAFTYGIDVDDTTLEAARLFTAERGGRYDFVEGFGEQIPLPDEAVEAIITQDTLEHVLDVRATLIECFRVLKPSGLMFCIFPSFYHPWGSHLTLVTNTPWLQLVFSDETLKSAYRELLAERGEDAYWYRLGNDLELSRHRFYTVNGTTVRAFRKCARDVGFIIAYRNVVPLFGLGRWMRRHPTVRRVAMGLRLLASMPILEEALLHRAIYILQKPPRTWR